MTSLMSTRPGCKCVSSDVRKSLAMLQGPRTEPNLVTRLIHACAQSQAISVKLTNYTKCGEAFTNNLDVKPIADPVSGRCLLRCTSIVEPSVAIDSNVAMPVDAASIEKNARLSRLLRLRRLSNGVFKIPVPPV